MFTRRYLRRSSLYLILIPVILLCLLGIYRNRYSIFSENLSNNYHHHHHHDNEHDPNLHNDDRNKNIKYYVNSKYKTTVQSRIELKTNRTNENFIENTNLNRQKILFSNLLNNERQQELVNPIQTLSLLPPTRKISPVIDTRNLQRFVHLDLKGAAPTRFYFEKLFPYLKQLGANGLLIEYEDMFPYTDRLSVIRHGFSYSKNDVQSILDLAERNQLQVMPLLQVYGHLEYVLKLKEFMHLREDKRYPQVITPCLEESYTLLFEMIDQMLSLHPSISYLHIGCDEVYYRLIHPQCVNLQFRDESDLFIRHVTRVAKYIKSKRPNVKLFIWHDMLSQLINTGYSNLTELIELVVPMIWAYVDDIKSWFDDSFWMKFAMFHEVWVASSYKGSSGEITTMSFIGHHQRNQQTWLEAMYLASDRYKINFTGIAATGWSRYDHMLSLCEFIPSSIPSLAYVLQTIVYGRLNEQLNDTVGRVVLGCNQIPLWERSSQAIYVACTFPGHEMYEMMYKHENVMRLHEETMSFVRLFITDVHIRQNYIHYKRSEECLERLIYLENQMIHFIDAFQNACLEFFTADIGPEWLQTYFMRTFYDVQKRINFIERALKKQSSWPQRPLPSNISRIVVNKRKLTTSNVPRTI